MENKFMSEEIYNSVLYLRLQIIDRRWSKNQPNYDVVTIDYIIKKLNEISNDLYTSRQELI